MFPDNCIKFLFECPAEAEGSKAKFLGINTEATGISLLPDTTYFVFMPYSHLGLDLRLSHSDLLNVNTDAENALPMRSALLKCQDLISEEKSFDDKINIIINNASRDINDRYIAGISEYCSLAMCLSHGIMDAKAIEMFTGYSDRYCRGVFKDSYGFSPKRYCRIVRFQGAMLEMMESREKSTLDIVSDHGYFDQTHFIKDFKQFAKVCPNEFRHALAPKAPLPVRA
jgi:AraC-like DNA-binding protein